MRQFKIVFAFELKNMLTSKTIIIITLIMSLLAFVGTSIPSAIAFFAKNKESESVEDEKALNDLGIIYEDPQVEKALAQDLGKTSYKSQEDLEQAVKDEEVKAGFIVHGYNDYTYITYDSAPFSIRQVEFEEKLGRLSKEILLEEAGIDSESAYKIIDQPVKVETLTLGKDAGSGMALAFIFILVLYMLIILYGNNVASSVAREKDSRTMELLITSTRPKTLILGKVAATGLMGILQVASTFLATGLGLLVNRKNYPLEMLDLVKGTMTLDTILVYLVFSVLGYILYLFIYASLGSLVSKVEDISSAVAPITFLFLLAYFSAMMAMQFPDSMLIKITSFIPFISIFTMPIRYMLTSVSPLAIVSSSLIMLVSVVLLAKLSIYIYRLGSLRYGNRIKLKEVIRSFK